MIHSNKREDYIKILNSISHSSLIALDKWLSDLSIKDHITASEALAACKIFGVVSDKEALYRKDPTSIVEVKLTKFEDFNIL